MNTKNREYDEDDDLDLELDTGDEQEVDETPVAKAASDVDSDDVEIEIIDDTPEEDRDRGPAAEGIEDPTEEELNEHRGKVQKRLRELTRARHDERRRADQLARENEELARAARALAGQTQQMKEYIAMGQNAYITKSKELATIAAAAARNQLRQAYDAGDSEAIAAAQEAMTTAQMQLQEANSFRANPLPTQEEPAYNPQQQQAARVPAQPQVDDRTMDWKVDNPWFQRKGDEDMTDYAMSVHAKLVRNNGEEITRTPKYFQEIDRAMRKAFPDRFDEDDRGTQAPATKRPSNVVAPARRGTAAKKIRLTRTQVNIAKRLGITPEGYARQLVALENDNG